MSKMRVVVILEFDDVDPGSPEDDNIVNMIGDNCSTIRLEYGASNCWLDDVLFLTPEGQWD